MYTNLISIMPKSAPLDVDAQAFITAASITDNTQKNAINNLVVNMKAAGIWSKMKAIYPFVGGTASTHKWNLKDPRDLDAAFRLTFAGGWTHSSTGALGSVNGYANTYLNPSLTLLQNSTHVSYYSRTNPATITGVDIGVRGAAGLGGITLISRYTGNLAYYRINSANGTDISTANTDSTGFYIANRTASNVINGWKNNAKVATGTAASNGLANAVILINALNDNGSSQLYSARETAFVSIGDSLTDTEALVFNQIVEGYEYELSRNVNTVNPNYYNTNYSNESNAFLYSTQITDSTQKTAINTFISDLKTANLWDKMYTVYPFIGGTATTHKFNLKNPSDSDLTYRLVFSGGWTHSATGILGNGTNSYANTKLGMNILPQNNAHMTIYSRTNTTGNRVEMGTYYTTIGFYSLLCARLSNNFNARINSTNVDGSLANTDSTGFYQVYRTDATDIKSKKGTGSVNTFARASVSSGGNTFPYFIGDLNFNNSPLGYYTDREYAFASLGEGYTDTDAANLHTIVQNFNTTLSRNI